MNVEHNLILELVKGCFTPNLTHVLRHKTLWSDASEWVNQSASERVMVLTDVTLLSDDTYWTLDYEDDKDDGSFNSKNEWKSELGKSFYWYIAW